MKVQEFPLAWRWTNSGYSVLPETVLSQLQPLALQDARRSFKRSQTFQRHVGITHSADISDQDGCAWLRQQHDGLGDIVTVAWSPDLALRTSWEIFTEYWSDFCFPSSDDVVVWPGSERWVLFYVHGEQFEYVL